MSITLNSSGWKRFFSVPCALVDSYIKLADGPALKVFLYLISCEGAPDEESVAKAVGITRNEVDDAICFWKQLGVISGGENTSPMPAQPAEPAAKENEAALNEPKTGAVKIVHASYAPKDIAGMLKEDAVLKELFLEAEKTLGRILRHADHETLISLRDYYGFDEPSIVLILSYCSGLGKTSARYYETVAKGLFEKGVTEFHTIEDEFERMREQFGYENEFRRVLGLETKLTSRQTEYANSWRSMGFGLDMIALAREKCVDNLNKLSFPYIDRIMRSWSESGIFTPDAAKNENKPQKAKSTERSFDIDEFESFTLNGKKEGTPE